MTIPLSRPCIGELEIEMVTNVLRSGQLSIGPCLEEFEAQFASRIGRRYAVAVSSGTAALHLCMMALGIGAKDEVMTTPFTFVASANCILYEQAMPSFVDIDPDTLNIDASAIRRALEKDYIFDKARNRLVNRMSGRTLKAILPVHVFGLPCDMPAILQIAHEWGLYVIEDACEALGAGVAGRPAGAFSHAATFAFYANKQITTAEGGMIVTDDDGIAKYCRSMRNQGRDEASAWLRHQYLGYNYRLSELHCALGLAQLERLDELLDARASLADLYGEYLRDVEQISLPWSSRDVLRSWFAYVIHLRGPAGPALRDRLLKGLRSRDIGCQAYFPAVHLQPYFQSIRLLPNRPLPNTETAADRCLALPLFPSMTHGQVRDVCSAVRDILAESPAVAARAGRDSVRARGAA
jgi:perosamine synthetase